MMQRYDLMTRRGVLNFKGHQTPNQCTKVGHEAYQYELKVLFTDETPLDNDGFIIDHQKFDETIQRSVLSSCEIMVVAILDAIETLLKDHNLPYLGLKIKIQPMYVAEENSAYFQEYRCRNKSDLAIVINL